MLHLRSQFQALGAPAVLTLHRPRATVGSPLGYLLRRRHWINHDPRLALAQLLLDYELPIAQFLTRAPSFLLLPLAAAHVVPRQDRSVDTLHFLTCRQSLRMRSPGPKLVSYFSLELKDALI